MAENTNKKQISSATSEYASFWHRLAAVLIDTFLLGFVTSVLGSAFATGSIVSSEVGSPASFSGNTAGGVSMLIGVIYYVFMTVKYGGTLGKMALKIKVQNEATGVNLTWGEAILREVVGKFVSSFVLLLGYFWMLWDPKKQTWHDKIGKSVVVKTD